MRGRPQYDNIGLPGSQSIAISEWRVFGVVAAFSILVLCMGYNGWFGILLPITALAAALVAKDADNSGLGFCVLISISFSYYFSLGVIPDLVTVIRIAIIVLLAICFLRLRKVTNEYRTAATLLALFFLVAAASSLQSSLYVSISVLKALYVGLFFMGLIFSTHSGARFPHVQFALIVSVAGLSITAFIFNPMIGYAYFIDPNAAVGASGKFSGILNHPQLLACLLAVNTPLLLHAYVASRGASSLLALLAFVATLLINAVSSSRTGVLATIVALVVSLYFLKKNQDPLTSTKVRTVIGLMFFAGLVGLATSFEQLQIFIYKTDDLAGGIRLSGRDEIIAASWKGFMAKPFFGNGFQVPSDFTEHGGATYGVSSDVTSIEKCFFLTMLLEEVGLVGTTIFFAAIISLIRTWFRKGAYTAIAAMFAFLTINLGEACILSPSSIGGLCWLSIFAVHNLTFRPDQRGPRYDPHRRGLY
jgi:hypothetical protein